MTVVARDADGVVTEEEVTIKVTNVDEAGKISFSALAPHPGEELTAKLSDSDMVVETSMRWEWSRSRSKSGSYTAIADAEAGTYTPTSGDVGYYLRATVSYKDREGDGKSAVGTSAQRGAGDQLAERRSCVPRSGPRRSWGSIPRLESRTMTATREVWGEC